MKTPTNNLIIAALNDGIATFELILDKFERFYHIEEMTEEEAEQHKHKITMYTRKKEALEYLKKEYEIEF